MFAGCYNYLSHFDTEKDICGGETVIRGTCVTLRTLLASLAEGAMNRSYPQPLQSDISERNQSRTFPPPLGPCWSVE